MSEIEQVFLEKNNEEDFQKNLKIQDDFSKSNEEILDEINVENARMRKISTMKPVTKYH